MSGVAFDEPPGLRHIEEDAERAIEKLKRTAETALREVRAAGLEGSYSRAAAAYKTAAEVAQRTATKLTRAATAYELTVALARREGMVDP